MNKENEKIIELINPEILYVFEFIEENKKNNNEKLLYFVYDFCLNRVRSQIISELNFLDTFVINDQSGIYFYSSFKNRINNLKITIQEIDKIQQENKYEYLDK